MKPAYTGPDGHSEIYDIACDRDPEHKGTALAAAWDAGKCATVCHSHEAPEGATLVADGEAWRLPDGSLMSVCPNDDECLGRLQRI